MERAEQRIRLACEDVFDAIALVGLVHDLDDDSLRVLVATARAADI